MGLWPKSSGEVVFSNHDAMRGRRFATLNLQLKSRRNKAGESVVLIMGTETAAKRAAKAPLVTIRGLSKRYVQRSPFSRKKFVIDALIDVDLEIAPECLTALRGNRAPENLLWPCAWRGWKGRIAGKSGSRGTKYHAAMRSSQRISVRRDSRCFRTRPAL